MDATTRTDDRTSPPDADPPRSRRRPRWLLPLLAVGAAGLVVVLVWFQPQALLFDTVVDEDFPAAAPAAQEPDGSDADATDADVTDATDADAPDADAPDADAPDADAPDADATDADATDAEAEDTEAEEAAPPSDATVEAEPTGPVALASGSFSSRNRYTVTGTATVFELEDGTRTLRLEDFESTNGPDLFVYLTVADEADSDPALGGEFVDLGVLRGNIGNQNYAIPDDVDLDRFDTVVIWCRRFSSSFGAADLA
jgi:cytoskeletal protein RodZ